MTFQRLQHWRDRISQRSGVTFFGGATMDVAQIIKFFLQRQLKFSMPGLVADGQARYLQSWLRGNAIDISSI
jgi:hypothetical protein